MKNVILLGLCLLCAGAMAAEEDPLALLRPLEGNWSVVCSTKTPEGLWKATEPTSSVIRSRLGGKVIEEEMTLQMGPYRMDMLILFTFDPFRKIYRMAAVDSNSGMMDVAEGHIKGNALVCNNLRAKTFFPFDKDRNGAFRLTLTVVDANTFTFLAEVSFDEGKTWADYSRTAYTRVKG